MKIQHRKLILILVAVLALLIPKTRSTLLSFILALFLAGCLQGPIQAGQRRNIPRVITSVSILLLVLTPLVVLTGYGVYRLFGSVRSMLERLLPTLLQNGWFEDWIYRLITSLPPALQDVLSNVLSTLAEQKNAILTRFVASLGEWSSAWITCLPGQLSKTGIFLLFFLFCAIGYPQVTALIRALLPSDWQKALSGLQRETKLRLVRWCSAEARLVTLIFGELAVGLCVLRLDAGLWMAAVISLVDMIPLVGSGLILLPWAAARFLLGHKLQAAGIVILWFCAWSTRTVLEPKLVGHQLQLPSAISFLAAILGAKLWGLKGLILFPVLTAVFVGLFHREKKGAAQKSDALDP